MKCRQEGNIVWVPVEAKDMALVQGVLARRARELSDKFDIHGDHHAQTLGSLADNLQTVVDSIEEYAEEEGGWVP